MSESVTDSLVASIAKLDGEIAAHRKQIKESNAALRKLLAQREAAARKLRLAAEAPNANVFVSATSGRTAGQWKIVAFKYLSKGTRSFREVADECIRNITAGRLHTKVQPDDPAAIDQNVSQMLNAAKKAGEVVQDESSRAWSITELGKKWLKQFG